MRLDTIAITNFKNIADARLEFSGNVNCLLGNNGMGKSNLLDAIHYLSLCRSFTGVTDRLLVRRGEDFAMARAVYDRKGTEEEITLGMTPGRRKSLKRGGKEYKRLTEHIGLFPLVMVSPSDADLVRGAGEERRRWMDMVISQAEPLYLDALVRYNNALEQRNRMLRDHIVDHTLYEVVEMTLCDAAHHIAARRAEWLGRLSGIFRRHYAAVAGDDEDVTLTYDSPLATGEALQPLLDSARRHDEIVGHTSVGPHRDDIAMTLGGMPVRRTASQGQCKTFTVALRLAQHEFLHQATGLRPMLLLDDVFDKLDATRVERLVEMVASERFGQIFITDTNRTHLDSIMGRSGGDHRTWAVDHGGFTLLG